MICSTPSRASTNADTRKHTTTAEHGHSSLALASAAPDRFPAPTGGGSQRGVLVLSIAPFRDWLGEHMLAHHLTACDVARRIGRNEAVVRGWFGVRSRDWRTQPQDRFVVHTISELVIEHVGIALTANPRLVPELYPHMAEPVCQYCGAATSCTHLGHALHEDLAA